MDKDNRNCKKIKVMHFIGSLNIGGAEKVVTTILKGYDRNRCKMYLLTLQKGPLEKDLIDCNAEIITKPFSYYRIMPWLYNVVREIRRLKIDVLHTHLFTTDILGRLVGWLAKVPVLVTTYHAPSTWKRSLRLFERIKRKADMITGNFLNDGFIAISEEVRKYQIEIGGLAPEKFVIVSNPVLESQSNRKEARQLLDLNESGMALANVGSLKPIKGQIHLLRAFADMVPLYPNIRLYFIGDGILRPALEGAVKELIIDKNVVFLGARDDVQELLPAFDILVVSSLSEGISIAILEAMAAGIPVIATDVGGNPDLIKDRDTGILVPPENPEQLSKAIRYLVDRPDERQRIASQGNRFVDANHSVKKITDMLVDYYHDLYIKKTGSINADRPN